MGIPFYHARESITPQDISLEEKSRIVLSEYRSFEHELVSDALSLKYVLDGSEEYVVNGKVHAVHAGQFLIVQPGDEVKVHWKSPDLVVGLCLYFDEHFTREMLTRDHSSLLPSRKYIADRRLHRWFQNYDKGVSSPEDAWWMAAGLTKELLQQYHNQSNNLSGGRESTKHALSQCVHNAIIYMQEHINENFCLDDLSQHACLSKFHLIRIFKQATGMTPQSYFQEIRYRRACEMLEKKSIRIQDVAWELGFNEVAAFSKFFKKHARVTPSQWKRQHAWPERAS